MSVAQLELNHENETSLQLACKALEGDTNISFADAAAMCYGGYFMTNEHFSDNQSMHAEGSSLYYEDGAVLNVDFIRTLPECLHYGWRVKRTPEQIDVDILHKMHEDNKGYMLQSGSYEDCFKD